MSDQQQSPAPEMPDAIVPAPEVPVSAPEPASPGAEQAPASDSSPEAGAAKTPEAEPSVLEKFAADRKAEDKPVEKTDEKAAEAAKPDEEKKDQPEGEKPPEAKPEIPKVEYKYELPESITMDDEQKQEFHKALDAFRADPEKGAQDLLGMAEKAFKANTEFMVQEQWRTFNDLRKNWRTELMADPILGGAGHDTAMGVVARMRDKFASDHKAGTPEYEADLKAFDDFCRATGAGDNPLFLRMLHRVGRAFDEPPMPPPGARPVPDGGRRPGESRGSRMYPSMQTDSQS